MRYEIERHFETVENYAKASYAEKRQVGCIIVQGENIIAYGYNGMPKGWTNVCESNRHDWDLEECFKCKIKNTYEARKTDCEILTKQEVLHAEFNAIAKVAKSTQSCEGATLYINYFPCFECAKLIIASGIWKIFIKDEIFMSNEKGHVIYQKEKHYIRSYRSSKLLTEAGIKIQMFDNNLEGYYSDNTYYLDDI